MNSQSGPQSGSQPPKQRLRAAWTAIPLVVVILWIATSVRFNVSWRGVLDRLNLESPERFTSVVILALVCIAIVAIASEWRSK